MSALVALRRLAGAGRRFGRDTRGVVAVEMALWSVAIIIPLLNVTDVAVYIYRRMQVEIAAQAAAQTAWNTCNTAAKLPAAKNCNTNSILTTAMTNAAQATSLGTGVTVATATTTDGYYCVSSSNVLTQHPSVTPVTIASGTAITKPADCNSVFGTGIIPAEYVRVTTTYSFTHLFTAVSVTSLLPSPISREAWIRLS